MRQTGLSSIQASALDKRFGSVRALRAVDLQIGAGALVRVSGPNGAGKTTLLRILAGLSRPTAGEIRLGETSPFGTAGIEVRGRIGFLGQSASLYGELTVSENLRFSAALHGLAEDRIEPLLVALDLETVRNRPVQGLSQGFRRRAGLARALLPDPTWLFLDEPWNGLDESSSRKLVDLLRAGQTAGRTTLVASHTEPAGELAVPWDTVLHLDAGILTEIVR